MGHIVLSPEQLTLKEAFFHKYLGSFENNASLSLTDPNANFAVKNIATLFNEINKDVFTQESRFLLGEKIKKLFGEQQAQKYYRQLENFEIYSHDESSFGKPYCAAIDLAPFIHAGNIAIGGSSKAPLHLHSFCGAYVNLIFLIASQFAGAIADVSLFTYFDYFARKDFGPDYLKTHTQDINNFLQQIIYTLNDPSVGRGNQSVFFNTSIFDFDYFHHLFGSVVFPDGSSPSYLSVSQLQRHFMQWFNLERTRALLTFPVITASFLTRENAPIDQNFFDFLTEEAAAGNSFFVYNSDTVDSLASCCFDGAQRAIYATGAGSVETACFADLAMSDKNTYNVLHEGTWHEAELVQTNYTGLLCNIELVNGAKMAVTTDHSFPTFTGDVTADRINETYYIKYNTSQISTPDLELYIFGWLTGLYVLYGERPFSPPDTFDATVRVNYHLPLPVFNELNLSLKLYSRIKYTLTLHDDPGIVDLSIDDDKLSKLIIQCVNVRNLRLDLSCLLTSFQFREGIFEGLGFTPARIVSLVSSSFYANSGLLEDVLALAVSLGYVLYIDEDKQQAYSLGGEEKFSKLYDCYRTSGVDLDTIGFKFKDDGLYLKVKRVYTHFVKDYPVYCFKMRNVADPYFTLANGVVTHNCRLRSDITKNQFSYTLGGTGVSTGSKKVFTINMNRHAQLGIDVLETISDIHKYLVAYNEILYDEYNAGILPVYTAGYIHLDKQYLTVGISGMVEAAEYLGYTISDNKQYKEWLQIVLNGIRQLNRKDGEQYSSQFKHKIMFNTEFVPGEGLGPRFAKKDKEAGLIVDRDCYNSYFYRVEDTDLDIFDKFNLYSRDILDSLDGGSALHLNLDRCPDKANWQRIFSYAIRTGTNYFCWNVKATVCNDPSCGYIAKETLDHCPKCGGLDISYATRVIGYLRKIDSFSDPRQREAAMRFYHGLKEVE